MGLKSPFDDRSDEQRGGASDDENDERASAPAALWGRIDHMLRSRGLSLDEVRARPHGVAFEGLTPGRFYSDQLQTDDGRVDCCPPEFAQALERCEEQLVELDREGPTRLKMITRRDPYMHNSWYANLERMKGGAKDRNYLYVHPEDAHERKLDEGDTVRLFNDWGAVVLELRLDPDLGRGVVAMTHGWGNAQTPGMRVAHKTPGANQNALLPSGPGSFDPLSNQAFMTGVPVELARV
jgi:anaerobic selenocysteine-containing dehydrogenase